MPFSFLGHLACSCCHATYDADTTAQLCVCGFPLLARYKLDAARHSISKEKLMARQPTLWRYHELLPVMRDSRTFPFVWPQAVVSIAPNARNAVFLASVSPLTPVILRRS
jgi:threonine synthase